jgi:hypothetical protein
MLTLEDLRLVAEVNSTEELEGYLKGVRHASQVSETEYFVILQSGSPASLHLVTE